MLNSFVLNSITLNGSVGEYRVLGGSVLTSCTDVANIILIKPFSSSVSASCSVEGLANVNWKVSSSVLVNSGYSANLFKTDVMSTFVDVTVNTESTIHKDSILATDLHVSVVTDPAMLSSLLHFDGNADVVISTDAQLLLILELGGSVLGYVVVEDTNLDITKNLQVAASVLATISDSHLKHLYFHSDLNLEATVNNIDISEILADYIINGGN